MLVMLVTRGLVGSNALEVARQLTTAPTDHVCGPMWSGGEYAPLFYAAVQR